MKKNYVSPEAEARVLCVEDILSESEELAASYDPTGNDRNWRWGLINNNGQ